MIVTYSKHGFTARDSRQLVAHLQNQENDSIEILGIGNSVAPDLPGVVCDMEVLRDGSGSKAAFHHLSINPSTDYSREQLMAAAEAFRAELDPNGTRPWIVIVHGKMRQNAAHGHLHAHLVLGHVDGAGRALKDGRAKIRTEVVARTLEYQTGETPILSPHHKTVVKFLRDRSLGGIADWLVAAHGADPDKPRSAYGSKARQHALKMRRVCETPARVTTTPTLLMGLAVCEYCGAGLQMRTGKSGRYRYLTCSGQANKGKLACEGFSIRMEKADEAVIGAVSEKVLEPVRLAELVTRMAAKSAGQRSEIANQIAHHRKSLEDATKRLSRIYESIESGFADHRDPILRERTDALRLQRIEHETAIERLGRRKSVNPIAVDAAGLGKFSQGVRERLRSSDPSFRRQWLRLFVSEVSIGPNQIRISGPNDAICSLMERHETLGSAVPIIDREWRAIQNKTANSYVVEISL